MANQDVYERITQTIIDEISKGEIPWTKPWICSSGIVSHATGRPYSLLNALLLGKAGEYVTYQQAKKEGGFVKRGAKAKQVYFYKQIQIDDVKINCGIEEHRTKLIPILKAYSVFHIEDCEGLTPKYTKAESVANNPIDDAEKVAHNYIDREKIVFEQHRIGEAYFMPAKDLVQVPPIDCYQEANDYYGVLFHELAHSTGLAQRLNRFDATHKLASFGSADYSKEELVAEMASAMMLAELGVETKTTHTRNAAYIQGWLKSLRNDSKMVVQAANKAQKAVAYILGNPATP